MSRESVSVCIIFVAWGAHPDYSLVVAANRDEFHDRPAAEAAFWVDEPSLLAGRDLEAGGTWLGVTRSGRFAAITNFRDPANKRETGAPSRGELVRNFLTGALKPEAYIEAVSVRGAEYNGFSLFVGDGRTLCYYCNRERDVRTLGAGVYGLSNHRLDTPWPKVEAGKQRFAKLLDTRALQAAPFFSLMTDTTRAQPEHLPHTGLPRPRESALSSIFVTGDDYGTRCTTVLTQSTAGAVAFHERSFDANGRSLSTVEHAFAIAG